MNNNLISCCGLDCSACDARIATLNNDDNLRAATAEKWKIMYSSPDITPAMINCCGCRVEGEKIRHHSECEMRLCANSNGISTCGQCSKLDACKTMAEIFDFIPEAKANLASLNE